MSEASTAKLAAKALILPSSLSRSLASILNCLIAAIAVSVVFFISSKVGARVVLAKASSEILTSLAAIPV